MNSPHPNFGSKDDIFLLLEDLGGEPTLERWASHSLNVISSRLPSQQRQLLQHSPQLQSSQQRQSPPSWFFDLHLLQGLLLMMSASSLHLFISHSVLGQTTQTARGWALSRLWYLQFQKICLLWQMLEELQDLYGSCQHELSDHAVSLMQSHIDHIWIVFQHYCWQVEQGRQQRAPPLACWAAVLSPPPSGGGMPAVFLTSFFAPSLPLSPLGWRGQKQPRGHCGRRLGCCCALHSLVLKTFPLLCFSRSEHSSPRFTILFQHGLGWGGLRAPGMKQDKDPHGPESHHWCPK